MSSPSLLSVVIDCHSLLSFFAAKNYAVKADGIDVDINHVVTSIISFLHSYALLHRQNRLLVVAFGTSGNATVFPITENSIDDKHVHLDCSPWLPSLSSTIRSEMENFLKQETDHMNMLNTSNQTPKKHNLSSALSSTLCRIKQQQAVHQTQARGLIMQFDRDKAQNYNAVMNCIFSAQKLNVLIDALVCSSFDSHLLQQVCYLTEGHYLRQGDLADLLLTLQTHFLTDRVTRQVIPCATQRMVDFKASCHCHKTPVEFAFMCSVCLTLLCSAPSPSCPVCETPVRT